MIYALPVRPIPRPVRKDIALEISASRSVAAYVQAAQIVHIMNVQPAVTYYCIYCEEEVRPSRKNPKGRQQPAQEWYFEHVLPSMNRQPCGPW